MRSEIARASIAARKAAGTYRNRQPEVSPDVTALVMRHADRRSRREIAQLLDAWAMNRLEPSSGPARWSTR